ncbi:MAG: hypothetical protein KF861_05510 [Planctomycetaceae bacterium]|nr:hypothetical protein [Planctomycetaceae bacterium]
MFDRDTGLLPNELVTGLRALSWRVRGLAMLKGAGLLAALTGGALALALFADWSVDMGVAIRTGLLVGVCVVAAVTVVAAILRPLFRPTKATELAALVDAAHPSLGERMESAIELCDDSIPERHRGSMLMRRRLVEETIRRSRTIDFRQAAETSPALRWVGIGALTLLLLLAPFSLTREGYALLLARFVAPWRNLDRATNLYFHVENGDRTVARGSDVTITAEPRWRVAKTALPTSAWLHWRTGEGAADARRMTFDADSGTFRVTIPHVLAAMDYEISAGSARTRTFHIDVVAPPTLSGLVLRGNPPAYSGRPASVLDGPVGQIEVFEQSRLTFEIIFSQPVASAALEWERGVPGDADVASPASATIPVTLAIDRRSGAVTMTADRSGPFRFRLVNDQNVENQTDEPLELVLIADQPPVIEWTDRGRNVPAPGVALEIRPEELLQLAVAAADDVGVAELELHAEIVQSGVALDPLEADPQGLGQPQVAHRFSWDLAPATLKEGDLLSIRARAIDGRPWPGPQDAWTDSRLIRITADAESHERSELAQQQQQLRGLLEAARESVRQDRAATETLRKTARETAGKPESPDQRPLMTNLAEREKQLTQRLNQLAEVFTDHPLLQNIAEETRDVGTQPIDAAREQFQQAAVAEASQHLERLTNAADELASADERLSRLLKRFDELAALEHDLQRLQQLAEEAERLSNEVANFEQQWDQLTQTQELSEQDRQARQNALNEQQGQLTNGQQTLTSSLDQLLEERPEVLQAALDRQRERLQELRQLAERLADREEQLAENLEQETNGQNTPPAGESTGEPTDVPPGGLDGPHGDAVAADETTRPATPTEPSDPVDSTSERSNEPDRPPELAESSPQNSLPLSNETARKQQQLAEAAAKLALDTARTRGVETPSAQRAREFAESALQAAEKVETGLLSDAAETAREAAAAAQRTAEQLRHPLDPAPAPLQEQSAALATRQAELAEQLQQQSESPQSRQQAQAAGQRRLAEQTAALTEQLQQVAERLGDEPLAQTEQSRQVESAQQAAAEATAQMQAATQQIEEGRPETAAPQARAAAESLRQSATQSGELAASNPSEDPSPVPGDVGEQVAEARRQLQQAGEQLRERGPPASPPGDSQPSDAQPESQQNPPGEPANADPQSPPTGESPGEQPDDSGSPSPRGAETADQQQPMGEPPSPTQESGSSSASKSMQQVAESLRQAARELGMAPTTSDQQRKPGDQESQPSDGAPGTESGNSGKNPISLVELEAELKRLSKRDWGRLPGQLESELLQSTQKKPDGEYAPLIRMYFDEISRRRSANENLVPHDNELGPGQ